MGYDRAQHRAFWQEIRRAWQRIVSTTGGPIGWILNFVQHDLEALAPSEWNLLAFDVAALSFKFPTEGWGNLDQEDVWSIRLFREERHLLASLPSRKEGQELQAILLAHLNQWFTTQRLAVCFPKLTIEIAEERDPDINQSFVMAYVKMDHIAKRFEYCFAYLFAEHASYIRRCQECSRIFLAKRHDQIYCTPRCQTRVATRKWRAEHLPQVGAQNERRKRGRPPMRPPASSAEGGAHGTKGR